MCMGISILTSEFGLSSLVIILIGLIVVWTGYLKKQRSAWFVMLVIVFGWAFPIFIWHDTLFEGRAFFFMHGSDWLSLFADAKRGSGFSSGVAQAGMIKGMLVFLPVVVALFLPVKSFFRPAPQRI